MTTPARITVDLVEGRVHHTRLAAGSYLSPRPMRARGGVARVALVGTCATLLGGDDLRIEITVGPGAALEVVEPSGTVAYDARGGAQRWEALVRVGEGARLLWRGAPFVVSAGANVRRHLGVSLAETGRALIGETLVLGRSYEDGAGPLRATTEAACGGRLLLSEDLDLRGPAAPGIMGGNRVMASAFMLGDRPEATGARHETPLHGPGAVARALAVQAHDAESVVFPTWARWRARLTEQAADLAGAGGP